MFVSPMLLHKSDEPFDNSEWITELKLDGIRLLLSKFDGKTKLYTRHKNEVTSKYPELLNLNIPDNTVLDGELIVTDKDGKPDFEACMERFSSSRSPHEVSFSVFDVLYHKGDKITHLPLLDRKEILEEIIMEDTPIINKVKWTEGNGVAYFDLIKQHDLEGVVLKKADSKYQINKRSQDWLKVINYQYENVYISGLRKDEFGLLLNFENGSYAGIMEFMTPKARKEFYTQYRDFVIDENDKFVYLDPKLKIKVKYRNLTKRGLLRIASFVEWVS
ncbi:ATP-dependent DNA ligase [Bacillus sp. T33-2]|uniref:ATP-dependent DNA ligase n=1 Tax=Bacillus sp. T33-2 TaxID=2054168 RepID=UPI000C76B10C|nr:RNA ligase family protein [Bacillus sp. T33-2]PLR99552.1 ATP-dependent DNA ligase [Bacillus sp. T33-2]